jgi:8-oxo-dGTP pyrophosphatase MutT (NUDIX family)
MAAPIRRTGGRVLVVDPEDQLLLVHERLEDGSTHWLTPGGGTEGDEEPRLAATREAAEEVGLDIALAPDAEAVLVTRRLWSWGGIEYDQIDHFFLARVPAASDIAPRGLTDVERQTLLGFRWWTSAELRSTAEVLLPQDLGDVLDRVLSLGTHCR